MNLRRILITLGVLSVVILVLGAYVYFAFVPHSITTTLNGPVIQQTTGTHGGGCPLGKSLSC